MAGFKFENKVAEAHEELRKNKNKVKTIKHKEGVEKKRTEE